MKKLFTFILLLLGVFQSTYAQEPYAVLSEDNTTLTFYYDGNKASRNGMGVGPYCRNWDLYIADTEWYEQRNSITTVVFDESFANYSDLTSTACWFYGCSNLSTINGFENLNTSNVRDMSFMFISCNSLTTLDLSHFNTANVTDMSYMFCSCRGLTNLDVSSFNTVNVENMYQMFAGCSGLTNLDVSNFNTVNVTSMGGMFQNCSGLKNLNVNNFNTANVTDMTQMFLDCTNLTSLDVSHLNTKFVKNMRFMFGFCSSLTSLDVSNFNIGNVTDMTCLFAECTGLTTIYNGNTWSCDNSNSMFNGCTSLVGAISYDPDKTDVTYANPTTGYFTRPILNDGDVFTANTVEGVEMTFKVISAKDKTCQVYGGGMYGAVSFSVKSVTIPSEVNGFQVVSIGNYAFDEHGLLTTVTIPNSVTSIGDRAFYQCNNLTFITLGNSLTTIGECAFQGCGLTSVTIPNGVTRVGSFAFFGCGNLTSIDFPNSLTSIGQHAFDTGWYFSQPEGLVYAGKVAYGYRGEMPANTHITLKDGTLGIAHYAFCDCRNLTSIDIPNSVTTIEIGAFERSGLTSVTLPNSITVLNGRTFRGCSSLTSITIPNSVASISYAFESCPALTDVYCLADEKLPETYDAFYDCNLENVTLHVPAGCLEAYRAVKPWSDFGNIVEIVIDGKVKLSKTKATIEKGKTLTLKATITPSDLADKSVTWKSSNTKVATVTSAGKVKGVKAGTATITCTSKATGAKATCKVTVGNVKLDKTEAVINKGKTMTLSATVYPSSLTDKSVTWESSNTKIATVTSAGKVKGVKAGTATITCTSNATGLKATCTVTVVKGSVTLNKTEAYVQKGKTMTLKATVTPETLADKSVTWESSDTKIATVTSKGKVKGVKYGTATITCTSNATGQSATCEVTVGYVKLSKYEVAIQKGKTLSLKAAVYPTTLEDQSVTWKSSDENIVKVNASTGKIKGMKVGTATITCTSTATGLSATCEVIVGYVKLSKYEVAIQKGKTLSLKAAVYPTTLEDQSVTWESSDENIVKVNASSGKIKGMKVGTAIITCTSVATGITATCEVTVTAAASARSLDGGDDETTGMDMDSAAVEPFDVYDLSGRKVLHQVTSLDGLPDGIYIVNGKKILKKK